MCNKYYAVRVGRKTGIFDSWEETKAVTDKFSGAEFKAFKRIEEAIEYLRIGRENKRALAANVNNVNAIRVTIDGSYNEERQEAGWAYVITRGESKEILAQDSGKVPLEKQSIRNIAGEILAAIHGIQKAIEIAGNSPVIVQYDYEGLKHWITGHWKAKSDFAKYYVEAITPFYQQGKLVFIHVEAHKHWANKLVDNAARKACGCLRR